jgi:hypothetical protein
VLHRTATGQQETLVKAQRNTVLAYLKEWVPTPRKTIQYIEKKTTQYGPPYRLFGIFGCFTFIFPYFMWSSKVSEYQELLFLLRLTGGAMCALLIIKNKWPTRLMPVYAFLGHFTLLYTVPFMNTVMFLLSQGGIEWVANIAAGIVLLIVLVDWLSFLVLTALGIFSGFAFYSSVVGPINFTLDLTTTYWFIYTAVFTTIITFLFARRRKIETERRLAWIGDKFYGKLWRDAYRTSAEFAPVFNRYILIFSEKWTKPRDIMGEPANTASPYHDMPEIDIFNSIVPLTLCC